LIAFTWCATDDTLASAVFMGPTEGLDVCADAAELTPIAKAK
jgi:hypothetical protein